ncbi:MAG: DUF2786 domain-containing protein [Marinobacterium sp.]|nr:DUF2786 domain-containing protein [Marinobacterium sp.]
MTSNKRSKALNRVIKLLNLATSDVDHEADLALNHAHSVIYNHNIQREEIDAGQLCDSSVLDQIDWYGDWTDRPEPLENWELEFELELTEASNPGYGVREVNSIREVNSWQQRQHSPRLDMGKRQSDSQASARSVDSVDSVDSTSSVDEPSLVSGSSVSDSFSPDSSPSPLDRLAGYSPSVSSSLRQTASADELNENKRSDSLSARNAFGNHTVGRGAFGKKTFGKLNLDHQESDAKRSASIRDEDRRSDLSGTDGSDLEEGHFRGEGSRGDGSRDNSQTPYPNADLEFEQQGNHRQSQGEDLSGFEGHEPVAPPSFDAMVESGAFMVFDRESSQPETESSVDPSVEVRGFSTSADEKPAGKAFVEGSPSQTDDNLRADHSPQAEYTHLEARQPEHSVNFTSEQSASSSKLDSDDTPVRYVLVDEAPDMEPPQVQSAMSTEEDGFDEARARVQLATVINRIIEARDHYTACRDEREQGDVDEETEKNVRIQAELDAEAAAERAFRERAAAQLRWEAEMRLLRHERRKREEAALKQLRALRDEHEDLKKRLAIHEAWKAEQARLSLLDDISNQLQVAADHIADAHNPALERALELMDNNGLALSDLPLARIHHKSIFMRLLEREARTLEDTREREKFTQELLGRYLSVYHPPTVDLAGKVLDLLRVASSNSDSAEDAFADAQEIMERNSMSIRDLEFGKIDQISLFVRLLNWEADKLLDMDAREHFTAKMLDKYFEATTRGGSASG